MGIHGFSKDLLGSLVVSLGMVWDSVPSSLNSGMQLRNSRGVEAVPEHNRILGPVLELF